MPVGVGRNYYTEYGLSMLVVILSTRNTRKRLYQFVKSSYERHTVPRMDVYSLPINVHSSIIYNSKQKKVQAIQYPSIGRKINKTLYIRIKESYRVIKSKKVQITCYNMDEPQKVVVIERSQTQKDTYCMISFV